jgi:Trypsin-co-occurring domain 1
MDAVKITTEGGQVVYVEVGDDVNVKGTPQGGIAGVGDVDKQIAKLKEVGSSIAAVCRTIQTQVQAQLEATKPQELTLEFGVTLAGETGIPLITKGSVKGTFQVIAKWKFN